MTTFNEYLNAKFHTLFDDISNTTWDIPQDLLLYLDGEDQDFIKAFNQVIENDDILYHHDTKYDNLDYEVVIQDPYLNMERWLQHSGEVDLHLECVKQRTVDVEGQPVGIPSENPPFYDQRYEVNLLDEKKENLTNNFVVVNLLAQVEQ